MLIEHGGIEYESWGDCFWTGLLGFCGCGCSDELIPKFISYLQATAHKPSLVPVYQQDGNSQLNYLIAYICDKHDLTEHGGGIGAAWISNKGREWLARLAPEGPWLPPGREQDA